MFYIDIFLVLIDDILDTVVHQVLNLKKEELMAFIGINFYMGTHPAWTDHYSTAPDLNNPLISKTMPRDRFATILLHLYCNDNNNMPPNCKDKLYKIRLVDKLNKKFLKELT